MIIVSTNDGEETVVVGVGGGGITGDIFDIIGSVILFTTVGVITGVEFKIGCGVEIDKVEAGTDVEIGDKVEVETGAGVGIVDIEVETGVGIVDVEIGDKIGVEMGTGVEIGDKIGVAIEFEIFVTKGAANKGADGKVGVKEGGGANVGGGITVVFTTGGVQPKEIVPIPPPPQSVAEIRDK